MTTFLIIIALFIVSVYASMFKLFEKAGLPAWHGFIPVYNLIVWLKMIKRPWWWLFLLLIPGVDFIMAAVMNVETAKAFGKRDRLNQWMALVGVIYLPYLAFSDAEYVGPEDWSVKKKTVVREWGEAIIFAVVAASIIRGYFMEAFTIPTSSMEKSLLVGDYLFVSKMSYGAKIPNTPLAFPFAHHTMPGTTTIKSYLEWIKLPYFRLPSISNIERNDVVVFNYPEGDTVVVDQQNQSYYQIVRDYAFEIERNDKVTKRPLRTYAQYMNLARNLVLDSRLITVRPVDKRENYIKRCVAVSGDKVQVKNARLYINDELAFIPEHSQYNYFVRTNDFLNKPVLKEQYDISLEDMHQLNQTTYFMPLTIDNYANLNKIPAVKAVNLKITNTDVGDPTFRTFPHSPNYNWTEDFYGPLTIPKKGVTVALNLKNIAMYERVIGLYESNDLKIDGDKILINGKVANSYTFKLNYYFMMGDNRHNSADGRYFGFVPEDHIVGKAVFIWLSLDKEKGWLDGKIRWNRLFTLIH